MSEMKCLSEMMINERYMKYY
eukprot:UN06425